MSIIQRNGGPHTAQFQSLHNVAFVKKKCGLPSIRHELLCDRHPFVMNYLRDCHPFAMSHNVQGGARCISSNPPPTPLSSRCAGHGARRAHRGDASSCAAAGAGHHGRRARRLRRRQGSLPAGTEGVLSSSAGAAAGAAPRPPPMWLCLIRAGAHVAVHWPHTYDCLWGFTHVAAHVATNQWLLMFIGQHCR